MVTFSFHSLVEQGNVLYNCCITILKFKNY